MFSKVLGLNGLRERESLDYLFLLLYFFKDIQVYFRTAIIYDSEII